MQIFCKNSSIFIVFLTLNTKHKTLIITNLLCVLLCNMSYLTIVHPSAEAGKGTIYFRDK